MWCGCSVVTQKIVFATSKWHRVVFVFVQWYHYFFIKYHYGLLFQQVKIHPTTNPPSPPSYQTPLPQLSHHPGDSAPSYLYHLLKGHIAMWLPWEGGMIQTVMNALHRVGKNNSLRKRINQINQIACSWNKEICVLALCFYKAQFFIINLHSITEIFVLYVFDFWWGRQIIPVLRLCDDHSLFLTRGSFSSSGMESGVLVDWAPSSFWNRQGK